MHPGIEMSLVLLEWVGQGPSRFHYRVTCLWGMKNKVMRTGKWWDTIIQQQANPENGPGRNLCNEYIFQGSGIVLFLEHLYKLHNNYM